jgi:hypothetical protein
MAAAREPWYARGLRFTCTGCGKCCTRNGKYEAVYAKASEIRAIAARLGLSVREFRRRFTIREDGFTLLRFTDEGACVFLREKRCSIYDVRPSQCRTFPFWPENLEKETWNEEIVPMCEGVSPQGRLYSREEIEGIARATDGEGGEDAFAPGTPS